MARSIDFSLVLVSMAMVLVYSVSAKPYDRYDPSTGCKIWVPVPTKTTTTTTTTEATTVSELSQDASQTEETLANSCPICLEKFEKAECITTDCNHKFHEKCLEKSVMSRLLTCPMCRQKIIDLPSTSPMPPTTTYRPQGRYTIC